MGRANSLEKTVILGETEGKKEKRAAEDELLSQHHQLNRHESEQTPGDSEGQGSLTCCSPWVTKSQTCLLDSTTTNNSLYQKIRQPREYRTALSPHREGPDRNSQKRQKENKPREKEIQATSTGYLSRLLNRPGCPWRCPLLPSPPLTHGSQPLSVSFRGRSSSDPVPGLGENGPCPGPAKPASGASPARLSPRTHVAGGQDRRAVFHCPPRLPDVPQGGTARDGSGLCLPRGTCED